MNAPEIIEGYDDAIRSSRQSHRLALNMRQPTAGSAKLLQLARQIIAERKSRREAKAFVPAAAPLRAVFIKPADEMIRIFRISAHVRRANIQQVDWMRRSVGDAFANSIRSFNERDFHIRIGTQELNGKQRAARSSA